MSYYYAGIVEANGVPTTEDKRDYAPGRNGEAELGKLLSQLQKTGELDRMLGIIDMLFDEKYMSNLPKWNRGYSSLLSRKIKSFIPEIVQTVSFRNMPGTQVIQVRETSQLAANYFRHLRNGIAHGRAELNKTKDGLYLSIMDYKKDGKTQTAFMYLPMSRIYDIFKAHQEIAKSAMHTKKKDRKERSRRHNNASSLLLIEEKEVSNIRTNDRS